MALLKKKGKKFKKYKTSSFAKLDCDLCLSEPLSYVAFFS